MLLWGVFAPQIGLKTINYAQAMLVTITIWLVVAPLLPLGHVRSGLSEGGNKSLIVRSQWEKRLRAGSYIS